MSDLKSVGIKCEKLKMGFAHITEVPYSADVPAIACGSSSLSAQLARKRALLDFGECYDNKNTTLPKSVFTQMTSHSPSL